MKSLFSVSLSISLVVISHSSCGASAKSKKSEAASALALAPTFGAWCGVDGQAKEGSPGIENPKGWVGKTPIKIRPSKGIPAAEWEMIAKSFATWEAATGIDLFEVTTPDERNGDSLTTLNASLDDGANSQFYDASFPTNTGKDPRVVATTVYKTSGTNPGEITEADVRFNLKGYLLGDSTVLKSANGLYAADLETVSLHELGHLLGLAHIEKDMDDKSVMHAAVQVGDKQTKRELSPGDIARIKSIYAPSSK